MLLVQTLNIAAANRIRHFDATWAQGEALAARITAGIIESVNSKRGAFITFEGLDGCGKSTQLERLAVALRNRRLPVLTTREPGGTPTGERIRQVLLDVRTSGLDAHAELALMFASRAQHLREVILPAIEAGKIVLCDRFTDSSEAYQGGGRQMGSNIVSKLHELLCGGIQPDLTILMDSNVAGSVARARRRNREKSPDAADESRFEGENREFFTRVHDSYLEIAKRDSSRVVIVDARGTPDQTHERIKDIIFARVQFGVAAKGTRNAR